MRNLIFRDGTKTTDKEYLKGHFTYAEIGKNSHGDKVTYMRRWYILVFPKWFSIRIHHIQLPDLDRWPHDHPWSFLSIILRGGYWESWCHSDEFEACYCGLEDNSHWVHHQHKKVKRFNFKRKTDLHKIVEFLRPGGAWTLIFTGPESREWGFMTDEGWVSRVALNLGASEPREPNGSEPD